MNLVEIYIEEIHSVKEVEMRDWMNEPFVIVDITTDCYGNIKRKKDYFPISRWELIKENGYYMG